MSDLKIPYLEKDANNYFMKSTTIYGASKSGKSTIAIEILKLLQPLIPLITIFSPTEQENQTFKDIVPNEVIYATLEIPTLEKIYKRQRAATRIYNICNDRGRLRPLFMKVSNIELREAEVKVREQAEDLKRRKERDDTLDPISRKVAVAAVDGALDKYLIKMYKHTIRGERERLKRMRLNDEETYIVRYLDFNPNILIMFDDCATTFTKKFQKNKVVQDIFFQGRHSYITTVFIFQDDLNLESSLRKNSFVNIFTTQQCALAYFERGSNSFSKDEKKKAVRIINHVLDPLNKREHKKLVYMRDDDDPFRYTIAGLYDQFRFGSSALWNMCDKLRIARDKFDPESDELSAFRI